MNPLVSIIIPLFNRENLIVETLESVLSQTYHNWECIIVDDGSTDQSYAAVETFIEGKNQFKLYKRPVQHKPGGTGARNFGYLKSNGDYILWLDSDDLLEKYKLELQIKDLLQHNADLSISKWCYFPDDTLINKCPQELFNHTKTDFKTIIKSLGRERSFFIPACYLVKKDIITKAGLWLEDLHLNDDGEFYNRILINSKTIILNNKTKALYRIHSGERLSQESSIDKFKECILSWRLIEAHLKLIDEKEFKSFLHFKKNVLFNQLVRNNHKLLINDNKSFFSKQLNEYNSYPSKINRIKTRLYNLLNN